MTKPIFITSWISMSFINYLSCLSVLDNKFKSGNFTNYMEILKHRVNLMSDIDLEYGAEIDVRDHNGVIVLSHDYPSDNSERLSDFLKHFPKNRLLAINVKSCGIEIDVNNMLKNHKNYFLFDFSLPYLLKSIHMDIPCALRLSEYEKELFKGPKWAWIDSFHSVWYSDKYIESIKNKGYKIALVSPELHKRSNKLDYEKINSMINKKLVDAICTDVPDKWK